MEIVETVNVEKEGSGNRAFVLVYALASYMIGAGALFWLIFAAGGLAPLGFVDIAGGNTVLALLINVLLVVAFGVQHSVMARSSFKKKIEPVIPHHIERATFVLVSGVVTLFVIALWQTLDMTVWAVSNPVLAIGLRVAYAFGIGYLLASSLVTNHFELFGLRQAWLYFRGRAYTPMEFKQRYMYRYSRHPMMLGFLFILWCSPQMTVTRFTLAILFTIYIFEGIRHEEAGLIGEFGDKYKAYRKQIGLFFTFK